MEKDSFCEYQTSKDHESTTESAGLSESSGLLVPAKRDQREDSETKSAAPIGARKPLSKPDCASCKARQRFDEETAYLIAKVKNNK